MASKSAKQNCSTCLHGHEPHVNRMSKKSNPMLSVMAGNKSSFIGGARKRARNLALFFSIFYVSKVASVIGIAVHAEFAFGPCGRLSLLSRTEPCEVAMHIENWKSPMSGCVRGYPSEGCKSILHKAMFTWPLLWRNKALGQDGQTGHESVFFPPADACPAVAAKALTPWLISVKSISGRQSEWTFPISLPFKYILLCTSSTTKGQ